MKRILRLSALVGLCLISLASVAQSRKGVSILGDSYSTFKGHVTPETNVSWYSTKIDTARTDVNQVSDLWWHKLIRDNGYRLVRNNSYSGATICNTGYGKNDYTDRSFVTRLTDLGSPDIIYVFGGTNDDWAKSPLGEYKYSGWTREDLFQVRPATAYMIASLIERYPGTEIVVIVNSDLGPDVTSTLKTVADHYGVGCVMLHDIDKKSGHPTVKGMSQIASQIEKASK